MLGAMAGLQTSTEVDAWFKALDHPLKSLMLCTRDVILGADERMTECVKWSTPTLTFEGNLVSFQPRAKRFVSLLFHEGASIPGDHAILDGDGEHVRIARFKDEDDLESHADALAAVVQAWCGLRAKS